MALHPTIFSGSLLFTHPQNLLQQQGLSFSTASFNIKEKQDKDSIFSVVVAEVQMGKKSWFYAMKKAVSPSNSKAKKEKRSNKSKSSPKNSLPYVNQMSLDECSSQTKAPLANPVHDCHSITETQFQVPEHEQIKHVDSITYTRSCFLGKTTEEIGAIKIQTAYRGYMARKAFRSLRAMRRLNLWLQGQAVKRQTTSTLMRIQTMCHVQSQVRARRIRMAEGNETLQRQLLQKRKKAFEKQAFDLSPKSKEQVEASLRSKKQAAERREKAFAYAYARQQTCRNAQKNAVVDPNHLNWGWSWSHRWDTIRQWETGSTSHNGEPMVRPFNSSLGSGQRLRSSNSTSTSTFLVSKSGTSRVNTGCQVGLANKRHFGTSLPFTSAPRIMVR